MAKTAVAPARLGGTNAESEVLTLLGVDDDPFVIEFVSSSLEDRPIIVVGATDSESAMSVVHHVRPRIVLMDIHLPDAHGIDLMTRIHQVDPETRVHIMTGQYSPESAVRAIQDGAEDYIHKPISPANLRHRADRWLEEESVRRRAQALERELLASSTVEGIVGRSPVLIDLLTKVRRVAPHCTTALVTGETGTGKESLARAVHAWSKRSGPFIVCNCAAIVETLFESELFGHRKGAFTGATNDRKGLIESAEGGTIFLDEVGEVPPPIQAKLLRFLQRQEVHPVGAVSPRIVDVRVVAATNRNLRDFTVQGGFREDLFYRLSTVELKLPSLRERKEDLPLLIRHFLAVNGERFEKPGLRLSRRVETLLNRYDWPGNIRELENSLAYASMLAAEPTIDVDDLPDYMKSVATNTVAQLPTMAQMEYDHAMSVLDTCDGNRAKAAAILGIGRATLYRLLAKPRPSAATQLIPAHTE